MENLKENTALDSVASRLRMEAINQVGLRQIIEERWHEDLRQYNGAYDPDVEATLQANESSKLFVNITRPKTRVIESRLADMLFGTDDRNFALKPTPVPMLRKMEAEPVQPGTQAQGEVPPEVSRKKSLASAVNQARQKAEGMETEIDDQLREADYGRHARMAIHDACVIGTGVIKGPVMVGRTRRAWRQTEQGYVETVEVDERPAAERVDPWNFFPDMGAIRIEEARFVFERTYATGLQLQTLLDDPFYSEAAVMLALMGGPKQTQLSRNPTQEKREAGGDTAATQVSNDLFEIWTYFGPLSHAELRACGVILPEDAPDEMETMACVVMCGTHILKAFLTKDNRLPYQVFNYEKDENSIFGYGLPRRMRSSQIGLNSAVRALMDNAGLSVGPQFIYNEALVEPADGDYRMMPKKGWRLTDKNRSVNEVFRTIDLSAHHAELMNLVQMWNRFADEETGIPLIAQGEQGPHITKTANGMAMLLNAANVVVRSIVRNWDDGITIPLIQGFYAWNMRNNPREEIKGDYEIDARGSTVLLAKEIQSQNLMTLATTFATHPIFGPMTKHADLYRKTVQAMSIPADEVILNDDEIQAAMQQQQEGQPQQAADPATIRLQTIEAEANMKMQLAQATHEMAMQKLTLEIQNQRDMQQAAREQALLELATKREMTLEELNAKLTMSREKAAADREKNLDSAEARIRATQIAQSNRQAALLRGPV